MIAVDETITIKRRVYLKVNACTDCFAAAAASDNASSICMNTVGRFKDSPHKLPYNLSETVRSIEVTSSRLLQIDHSR